VLATAGLDWERWLATRSANLRQQIRRRERNLRRDHGLEYRLVEHQSELPGAMDALVALHRARWGDRSAAFGRAHEALLRRFAARALDRGWLRLWIAHAGGAPAAAWLGFRYMGADSYYQAGRAPRWDSHGLGFVLLAHTIRDALEAGMREYRFGLGGESYKSRFCSHDDGVVTVVAGPGPLPALVVAAARAVRAAPRPLRTAAAQRMRT
jgi:CelD/BcsL family acetyltransferase involved in cellulose biosynthesis